MKKVISQKNLESAIMRSMKAKYYVDTDVNGATNMVLFRFGGKENCITWRTVDSENFRNHVRFQAFGDEKSGEVLMSSLGEHANMHLLGKGNDEHGVLLLIQRVDDVFSVVWNSDLPENKATFFMSVTDQVVLIELIGLLAGKLFPTIKSDKLDKAITLLIGGANNE